MDEILREGKGKEKQRGLINLFDKHFIPEKGTANWQQNRPRQAGVFCLATVGKAAPFRQWGSPDN